MSVSLDAINTYYGTAVPNPVQKSGLSHTWPDLPKGPDAAPSGAEIRYIPISN